MDDKPTASGFSNLTGTPVAALSPELHSPGERYLHAVVILLWPFSSATKQFSLLVSEPDFRLRGNKGQVKVIFREAAAEAVAKSNVGIGATVFLSLQGAEWRSANHEHAKSPDYSDWELLFRDRVLLEAQRTSLPLGIVNLEATSTNPAITKLAEPPVTPKKPLEGTVNPDSTTNRSWASPAFFRASKGPFSSPLFNDHAEEDGYILGRKRKRTKFGRPSSDWVYVDSPPSPPRDEDIWDEEKLLENSTDSQSEQAIRTEAENKVPTPYEALPEKRPNVEAPGGQAFHGASGGDVDIPEARTDQQPVKGLLEAPSLLDHAEFPHQHDIEPTAVGVVDADKQQVISPSVPENDTLHLYPEYPRDTIAVSPCKSLGRPLSNDLPEPAGLLVAEVVPEHLDFDAMSTAGLYKEHNHACEESQEELRSIESSPSPENKASLENMENGTPFNPLPREEWEAQGHYYPPDNRENDLGPELSHEEANEIDIEEGYLDDERFPEELAAKDGSQDRAISIESSEESSAVDEAGHTPEHRFPTAVTRDYSPLPQEVEQYSISSDGDSSRGDEAGESPYPRPVYSETTSQRFHEVYHDESESESAESEAESVVEVQMAESLHPPAKGDSDSEVYVQYREPYPESLVSGEPDEDIAEDIAEDRMADKGDQAIIVASPSDEGDDQSSVSEVSDDDKPVGEMGPPAESLMVPASNANEPEAVEDTQSLEPALALTSLQQYLSDAIRNVPTSHGDPELVVNETDATLLHGEEIMSRFLTHQPTDFITPDNTQDLLGGPHQKLTVPIHLDINIPTPQPTQSKDLTSVSIPSDKDQPETYSDSHSPTSPPIPQAVEGAELDRADTQIAETTEHIPAEGGDIIPPKAANEFASKATVVEAATPLNMSGLRSKFSYFCPLARLIENFNQSVDCISVVADITPINRATQGARDYYVNLQLTDKSLGGSTITAQIFHRKRDALPIPVEGDAILLRNFRVQSLNHSMVLTSTEKSAWAFFSQEDETDVQIDGGPVEYGAEEQEYAAQLAAWYKQEGAGLVTSNNKREEIQRESIEASSITTSEAGSQLKGIIKKRRRPRAPATPRITIHELRHGRRYVDAGSPSDNESIHELRNGTLYAHPD